MSRIETLTPAQIAKFPEYVEKWTRIGLSCEPCDYDRAKTIVTRMYEQVGMGVPLFVLCDSPLSAGVVVALLKRNSASDSVRARVRASVRESVWESVRASVGDSVSDSVGDSVRASVGARVGASVRARVRNSVWDSVGDSVWASVRARVRNSVWESVWDSVWASVSASVSDSVGANVWDSVGARVRDSVSASVKASVRDSVSDSVLNSVSDSVWASVRASVSDSVSASVSDSVSDSVSASVGDIVWDSVGDSVWASVWASMWDSVSASAGDIVSASGFGSHDAGWLSYYDYFRNEVGIEKCHEMDNLFELASVCGWWTPYKDVCVLQHRHNTLNRDEQGLLHCPDGYAVGYRDGWGVYAWHGVRVPEQVIMAPKTLTAAQVEQEANTEVRRVMVERFGQDRFLMESGAKAIHADEFGTLYRKEVSGDEPIVMVKVINSTPEADGTFKDYFLRVPPDITKAREAVAWTADMTAEEYEPLLET